MSNMDTKIYQSLLDIEVKASKDSEGVKRFEGYLAYFGNVDSYGDVIVQGAFKKSLSDTEKEGKFIPVLEQHGGWGVVSTDYTPVGYYEQLYEDEKGLYAKGILYDTVRGSDLYTLLKQAPKGSMGQSIGFRIIGKKESTEEEYRQTGVRRYLTEIKLMEGSIVTFPANEKARVEDVKMAEAKKRRDLEDHFKKNGFSASEAKKAVAVLNKYENSPEEDLEENSSEKSDEGLTLIADSFKKFQEQLDAEIKKTEITNLFKSFSA